MVGLVIGSVLCTATVRAQEVSGPAGEERPVDRSALPRWHEWTLWGAGAISLGVGLGFLLGARDIRDQIALAFAENPNDEFEAAQQDEASNKDLVGYIVGGTGVALIGVGTALYFIRQGDTHSPPNALDLAPRWYEWSLWAVGAAGLTYAATLFTQAAHREGYAEDLAAELGGETSGTDALEADADDMRAAGALFAAAGVVVGAIGATLYVVRTNAAENAGAPQAGISWEPGGGGVWVRVSF